MKRIIKLTNSEILQKGYKYPTHRKEITKILLTEQKGYCAYTECKVSADPENTILSVFKVEIDHFNPEYKNTEKDSYFNWFLVSGKINLDKGSKWLQPILSPIDEDFENRVLFDPEDGTYYYRFNDIESKNLIQLLRLNEYNLPQERKKHIESIKDIIVDLKMDITDFLKKHPQFDYFRRAIEEVFPQKKAELLDNQTCLFG